MRHPYAAVLAALLSVASAASAQGVFITGVPDVNQPISGSIGNPTVNACAPASAANITVYWDQVRMHPNALGLNAGLAPSQAADYLFYFMDTDNWGSTVRLNGTVFAPAQGTYNADIMPGLYEFARWDAANVFTTPPPALPLGKTGYDWVFGVDTVVGFPWHMAEIDSGRPDIVSFAYWNPAPTTVTMPDPTSGELLAFFTWGPPAPTSPDPLEVWNQGEGSEGIGHAVTGVGYLQSFDPDGPGGLPQTDWIICHDNWPSTSLNVTIPWANWKQTVRVSPGWHQVAFTGVYCPNIPDSSQPPAGAWGCATANYCAPFAAFNATEYWDVVVGHANAAGVNAGFGAATATDYIGYFMATNGTNTSACAHPSRSNPAGVGTWTVDIAPGALDYVRWDNLNQLPPLPSPGLPASKMGYTWRAMLDTTQGFTAYTQAVDSCRPPVVVFRVWNPQSTGIRVRDSVSGELFDVFLQGSPIGNSSQFDTAAPSEDWPCATEGLCPRSTVRGHAVTGVGYAASFDPDGPGPLQTDDWVICHDNWSVTPRNVMVDWTEWNATVFLDPAAPVVVRRSATRQPAAVSALSLGSRVYDLCGRRVVAPARAGVGPWKRLRPGSYVVEGMWGRSTELHVVDR